MQLEEDVFSFNFQVCNSRTGSSFISLSRSTFISARVCRLSAAGKTCQQLVKHVRILLSRSAFISNKALLDSDIKHVRVSAASKACQQLVKHVRISLSRSALFLRASAWRRNKASMSAASKAGQQHVSSQ